MQNLQSLCILNESVCAADCVEGHNTAGLCLADMQQWHTAVGYVIRGHCYLQVGFASPEQFNSVSSGPGSRVSSSSTDSSYHDSLQQLPVLTYEMPVFLAVKPHTASWWWSTDT